MLECAIALIFLFVPCLLNVVLLEPLRQLANLVELDVSHTNVTDKGEGLL
jgi:hypothetical protein